MRRFNLQQRWGMSLRDARKVTDIMVSLMYENEPVTVPMKIEDLNAAERVALMFRLREVIATCPPDVQCKHPFHDRNVCNGCQGTDIEDYAWRVKMTNGEWD